MTRNPPVISEADSRAIDALLDAGRSTAKRISNPVDPARLAAAQNLLNLLGEMPLTEPPANLVAKTMDFILRRADVTGPQINLHDVRRRL